MSRRCSSTSVLQCCGYALHWLPRMFSMTAVAWGTCSHIAYTAALELSVAHYLLLVIGVFSGVCAEIAYFRTYFVGPGSPREFPELYPGSDAEQAVGFDPLAVPEVLQSAVEAKNDGGVRFCNKCRVFKPDRAHHCRQCGFCVLRMDHHCIWFSCCVGLHNHKFFLQFLVYVSLLCLSAFVTAVPLVMRFFDAHRYAHEFMSINFVFYTVLSGVFSLVLPAFTAYSLYNAAVNRTTLESLEGGAYRTALPASQWRYRRPPSRDNLGNVYDIGVVPNLDQVLGESWVDWLLPVRSDLPVNGTKFPVNEAMRAQAEERAQTEVAMHRRKQQQSHERSQERYLPSE